MKKAEQEIDKKDAKHQDLAKKVETDKKQGENL